MASIRLNKKYLNLTSDCVGGNKPFTIMAELACFCGLYAFNKGEKIKSSKIKDGQEIRDAVFINNDHLSKQVDMLAVAHTKDPNILQNNEESINKKYKILEDYANAGLQLFKDRKDKNTLDDTGLDTVLAILREQTKNNLGESIVTGMGNPEF